MICHKVVAGCLIITSFYLALISFAVSGAAAKSFSIPYIKQKVVLDGVLDDEVWSQALRVPIEFEVNPAENAEAPVKTTAYIFENGETLFVGFDARDSDPEQIRAYLSERDDIWQSDYLGFTLDTFNDSRRGYQFLANAIGIQSDSIIDEITEGQDFGWDAIWRSEGKVNPNGYAVEFAIPLKILRFSDRQGSKRWGIQFFRILPRDVKHKLSNTPQDRNSRCQLCQFDRFTGMSKIDSTSSLILIPSITMEGAEQRDLQEPDWQNDGVQDRESLDLRWAINQNNFASATVNPDFSEVETDAIQVETNKPFAVFVPERRSFFTEGADFFSNWSRLIHTKIFLAPEYGVKLIGKNGDHSYGVMSIEDKDTRFLVPGSQTSKIVTLNNKSSSNQILRYRYDVGKQGNIGLTYTDRDAEDYANKMLSLNGKYWLTDSDFVRFQWMTSDTDNPLQVQQDFGLDANESGQAFTLNYTHSSRNWTWFISQFQFGDGFRADSGFNSRSNWKRTGSQIARNWYPGSQTDWWKKITFSGQWIKDSELKGPSLLNSKGIELAIESSYQSEFGFGLRTAKDRFLTETFDLNVRDFFALWTPFAGLDVDINFTTGDQIDFATVKLGKQDTLEANFNYQLNQHWKIVLEYINQSLKVPQEDGFNLDVFNLNTLYQYNRRNFFRITLQGATEGSERSLATQLLYKYKVNPFTLFYIGYSDEGFKTIEVKRFKKTDRRVFVKFSYAWQM